MVQVVFADNRAMLCEGVRAALHSDDTVRVVATAQTGAETRDAICEHRPHVLVVDAHIPPAGAYVLVEFLKQNRLPVAVVLLAETGHTDIVENLVRLGGIRGVLAKQRPLQTLVHAITVVGQGGIYCDPVFAEAHDRARHATDARRLTSREVAILALIGHGQSSKEIAATLRLSPRTIDHARERIKEALNIRDLAGLVRYAIRMGLVDV